MCYDISYFLVRKTKAVLTTLRSVHNIPRLLPKLFSSRLIDSQSILRSYGDNALLTERYEFFRKKDFEGRLSTDVMSDMLPICPNVGFVVDSSEVQEETIAVVLVVANPSPEVFVPDNLMGAA